ncbi:MAG: hypothetical protein AVDCRST_MAG02-20 [uncultured Rubrobacteraceae bacterium]|uniref:Uncharacterized protein n=1 Tax=uncultured Rubrobacteraceae bacterium TaxID=349277 RepID=A0A6J4QQK5_9ACTN|nr:MAG: hypothetical protein AVDCRST_MAG02-20 [uncultured Rubrobacteraceae bacterium]
MARALFAKKIEPESVTNASGGPYSCTARNKTDRNALRSCLRVRALLKMAREWLSMMVRA